MDAGQYISTMSGSMIQLGKQETGEGKEIGGGMAKYWGILEMGRWEKEDEREVTKHRRS